MNIDKDKKTLKKIVTELRTSFEECPNIIAIMYRFEKEDIQAISNEISELETWKKIAEKLAEEVLLHTAFVKPTKENIKTLIENARKEVEKDV